MCKSQTTFSQVITETIENLKPMDLQEIFTTEEISMYQDDVATFSMLEKIGIEYKTPVVYPFKGDFIVYTYTVYLKDTTSWGYSSEDDIFYKN